MNKRLLQTTLEMDFFTLQKNIEALGIEVFSLNDVVKITGQDKVVVKSTLSRLTGQGKIIRLKPNYYSLRKIENKFMFQQLFPETYIGLHSALEFYGSTTQRFNNLDLISGKTLKKQTVEGTEINFHKVKKELFSGYRKVKINTSEVFVSNIEKTIVDCIYFSSIVYLTEVDRFIKKYKHELNKELIIQYLNKVNSPALNKRTGFLLAENGIHIAEIKLNNKYDRLNKNLGHKGRKNSQWKLLINEEI